MKLLAYLIAALTMVLTVACLMDKHERRDWKQGVVHLPFPIAAVGMVGSIFFSVLAIACPAEDAWSAFIFCLFVVLGNSMMAAYHNCVIFYDGHGFAARNIFGIRRDCRYAEVEGLRCGRDNRLYFHGHSLLIDESALGSDRFMAELQQRYRQSTGKPLPASVSYKRRWDPMNGHLEYPWLYFLLWVAVGLFCAGLPILMTVVMNAETDPEQITVHQISFSRYEVDDGTLLLYPEGEEEPYRIGFYRHYGEDLPDAQVLCSGEMYAVGDEAGDRYVVSLTGPDGTRHITPESERRVYRDSQRTAYWLLLILCPAGVIFSWFGIAVARHPERYSDRVRRLFYQEGYLHW